MEKKKVMGRGSWVMRYGSCVMGHTLLKTQDARRKTQDAGRRTQDAKGFALIIVIFAMMVFAVLGWTLAVMQSTDFEVNLRNLDSEQALELAEAGIQYALQQLSLDSGWRVTTGTDCNDSVDWLEHNFASGQYAICCRNPTAVESGEAVIEAQGYIPDSGPNYRAMRQVKLEVSLGSLTNAVMTQIPDPMQPEKGLLNWWPSRQDDSICIEGIVSAGHYNGDGNAVYDQLGSDYDPLPAPILPDDCVGLANSERIFTGSFPSIDLQWFYDNTPAGNRWPSPSTRQLIAPLTAVTEAGGRLETSVVGFFTGMTGQAVRLGVANWYDSGANWRCITAVLDSGRDARVDQAVGAGWQPGVSTIKIMRRFESDPGDGLWYIGGQIAGGTDADLLIDVRNASLTLSNTYLITEGTILIKGNKKLKMNFTGGGTRYPNLATKNGNIISRDPASANNARQFEGVIYSENGLVDFNYLDGTIVMGDRINFDGDINVEYKAGKISNNGFSLAAAVFKWQEE